MTTPDDTIEDTETRRKRLIYRSWHRGTREMDLILGSFADKNVPLFSEAELSEYESLLDLSDPDLYDWITGRGQAPANLESELFCKLKAHKLKSS